MLVSEQVPDQQFIAVFTCKKIKNLGIESIERLKIHGKQTEDEFPAWSQEFELAGKQPTLSSSTVDNLASHNFPKALHTTANKKNQEKKVSENKVENISSSNRTNYDIETLFPLTKKIRLSLIDENSKLTAFTTILMLVCLLYFLSLLLLFLEWAIGVPLLFLSIGSGYLIAVLAKRKKLNSYTCFT